MLTKIIKLLIPISLLCLTAFGMEFSEESKAPKSHVEQILSSYREKSQWLRLELGARLSEFTLLKDNFHEFDDVKEGAAADEAKSHLRSLYDAHYRDLTVHSNRNGHKKTTTKLKGGDLLRLIQDDLAAAKDFIDCLDDIEDVLVQMAASKSLEDPSSEEDAQSRLSQQLQTDYLRLYFSYLTRAKKAFQWPPRSAPPYKPFTFFSAFNYLKMGVPECSAIASLLILLRPLLDGIPTPEKYQGFIRIFNNGNSRILGIWYSPLPVAIFPEADPLDAQSNVPEIDQTNFTVNSGTTGKTGESRNRKRKNKRNLLRALAQENPLLLAAKEEPTKIIPGASISVNTSVPCDTACSTGEQDEAEFFEYEEEDSLDGPISDDFLSEEKGSDTGESIEGTTTKIRMSRSRRMMLMAGNSDVASGTTSRKSAVSRQIEVTRNKAPSDHGPVAMPIYLTKKTLRTFDLLMNSAERHKVRLQDYENLLNTFYKLNRGGFLRGLFSKKGKEDHRNVVKKPQSQNVLSLNNGVSAYFVRYDGVTADLNIHPAHGKDGDGEVVKEYRAEYMLFFRKLGVSSEKIQIR